MTGDGAVSIGRNIGQTPMTEYGWEHFINEVEWAITQASGAAFGVFRGASHWRGVGEESALIPFVGAHLEQLEVSLQFLAAVHSQDAIALLVGSTRLIPAVVDA